MNLVLRMLLLMTLIASPAWAGTPVRLSSDTDMSSDLSGCSVDSRFSVWVLRQNSGNEGSEPIIWNITLSPLTSTWVTSLKMTLNTGSLVNDFEGFERIQNASKSKWLLYLLNEGGTYNGNTENTSLYRMDTATNSVKAKWDISSVVPPESSGLGAEGLAIIYMEDTVKVFVAHQGVISGKNYVYELDWKVEDFETDTIPGIGWSESYAHEMPYSESNSCSIATDSTGTHYLEVMHTITGDVNRISVHKIEPEPGALERVSSYDYVCPMSSTDNTEGHGVAWNTPYSTYFRRFWVVDGGASNWGLWSDTP